MVVFGFSNSGFVILAQTIFQIEVEPRYLGRVISLWSMGGGIGSLTALPIGLAADEVGLRWALGAVSSVLVLATIVTGLTMLPRIRRRVAQAQYVSVRS
jgi:MFS family permease